MAQGLPMPDSSATPPHGRLELRPGIDRSYPDLFTPEVRGALQALSPLDSDRKRLMKARIARRFERARSRRRIAFLEPDVRIGGTQLAVREARAGRFEGCEIPADLRRQWIQGT